MRYWIILIAAIGFSFAAPSTFAQDSTLRPLTEQEIEQRAKEIGMGLRCVMCKNESIEESPSTTAQDMRRIVRERIRDGQSDEEIIDYMQSRYGDFILLKPPVQPNTYLLWSLPFIFLALALLWFWRAAKKYANHKPRLKGRGLSSFLAREITCGLAGNHWLSIHLKRCNRRKMS